MTSHGAFAAEEFGSGSRPTPLIDAPAWLMAQAGGQGGEGDRATLTPTDRAFLESIPAYEEPGPLLPSLPPPTVVAAPSTTRRVLSLLLFVVIAGSASAVLVLAVLRYLGHPVLP
jgi:hypothetical protein